MTDVSGLVEEFYGLVIEEWNEAGESRMEIAYNLREPVDVSEERWVILRPPVGFKMDARPTADTLARLQAENERLRGALVEYVNATTDEVPLASGTVYECSICGFYAYGSYAIVHSDDCPTRTARDALQETSDE